jgi:NAD-dependent deacetylase sirtuin 4
MRISVPGLPLPILSATSTTPPLSPQEAVYRLSEFIKRGNLVAITGAGVSVDSGIRAYRGQDGRYMNPNYKYVYIGRNLDVL